jgi:protein-disulfide isomerase
MEMQNSLPGAALKADKAIDHILGPADAMCTVIEYGDLECPSCKQAQGAMLLVRNRYARGVKFVFRHFPLMEVHPHAELAAQAAEAAGAQGKFWQYIDLVFEQQPHLKRKDLDRYAGQLELDMTRFRAEMDDQVYSQRVREHMELGNQLRVRATPTFFVNGKLVDVSFGLQQLESAVGKILAA